MKFRRAKYAAQMMYPTVAMKKITMPTNVLLRYTMRNSLPESDGSFTLRDAALRSQTATSGP